MSYSTWHTPAVAIVAYRWRCRWYTAAEMAVIRSEKRGRMATPKAIDAQLHALPYTEAMLERLKG